MRIVFGKTVAATLAALVLAERVLPGGHWLARTVGIVLALSGGALAAGIW